MIPTYLLNIQKSRARIRIFHTPINTYLFIYLVIKDYQQLIHRT